MRLILSLRIKNVLLVDDSIVRGTTAKRIIQRAREVGAKSVTLTSAAPPVRFPNVYGIDIPTPSELVATGRDDEQICQQVGADDLLYQRLEDLVASAQTDRSDVTTFEMSVFDGKYVTNNVSVEYLNDLHQARQDTARKQSAVSRLNFSKEDNDLMAVN